MTRKPTTPATPAIALPAGIVATDLKCPDWKSKDGLDPTVPYEDRHFEIWYTPGFGWCIPTLRIRGAGRTESSATARTYAVAIDSERVCRIGHGPHIKATHTVYVRKSRATALAKFIALKNTGAEDANTIRDRISSRRAQGTLRRRSMFGF
jgi:hypothetical protein